MAALGGAVTSIQGKLFALAGIGGAGILINKLIDTNREFQTLKSSLVTVTGSTAAASKEFAKIEKFATTTPYDLQQVTEAFIKMKALGLDASEAALRSYGNTASAMGKSLNQMVEAVADAATGEFERLKEFGIKASKEGDSVTFTFQGITTTIKNSSAEITKYLQDIGNNKFGDAMSAQMKNLDPAFSNFNAAIDQLYVKVGEAGLNEALAEAVNNTTAWINALDAQAIADFTRSAIDSMGELVEMAREVGEAWGFVTDNIGRSYQMIEGGLPGAGGLGAGRPGYQLGDFNSSQNPQTFEDWARAVRENTEAIKTNRGAVAG